MIFIILCILSSTSLFVIFKIIDQLKIKTFDVIIVNYFVASLLGLLINPVPKTIAYPIYANPWFKYALIIGVLFILMFVVVGKSSQKVGIAITTVSGKMSVVIPISFSIFYDPNDILTNTKLSGILIALFAVFFTIYRKRTIDFNPKYLYLPVIMFFGMGIVDSFVKLAQFHYVNDGITAFFTAVLFFIALITGIILKLITDKSLKSLFNGKILLWGTLLGIGNLGSIYFILRALNHIHPDGNPLDGSVVFGIINIGIVTLSVLIGLVFFKEKLTRLNWLGVVLTFVAIYILSKI